MTINDAPQTTPTLGTFSVGGPNEDDPRMPFARAVALAGSVLAAVEPDQLGRPTPCTEFDVGQLCGHLVAVLRRVAVVGRGEDPFSVLPVTEALPVHGFVIAWTEAGHDVQRVWRGPEILDRPMKLPWATLPGSVTMAVYSAEITVHTWDLATATGQRPHWDDAVVGAALVTMQRALPADGRDGFPFAPPVAVSSHAPLIDQLVGWTGRQP